MKPFLIFALPRSRTAWLSRFLSYGSKRVGHDVAIGCSSLDELFAKIDALSGTVETGSVLGWKPLLDRYGQSRTLIIRRPIEDVATSLASVSMPFDMADLERKNALLDEVSKQTGAREFRYSDLDAEETAKAIFEICLKLPFDRNWWLKFRDVNIQVKIPETLNALISAQDGLRRLKAEAAAWKSP